MPVGRTLVLVVALGAVVAGGETSPAVATDEPWPTFVSVTSTERRATRPPADAVATAYRSGRFSVLCSMSVLGVYETERDKALRRKTIVWLYAIRSPARSGDLEISFQKEHGRWVLLRNITGSWSR